MRVKKYEAPTMQKALQAVKKDLGNDAVILHTKSKKRNGFLGLWGKEMVEITASRDINVLERSSNAQTGNLLKYYKKTMATEKTQPVAQESTDIRLLQTDLNEIKGLVLNVLKRSQNSDVADLSDELLEAYLMLIENEVSERISKDLVRAIKRELKEEQIKDKDFIQTLLVNKLVRMLSQIEPINCRPGSLKKIALIGPTGVGKTTTIAKLAAHFALKEKKNVALITIDTYRIAAVEQLRTYAEIINIPLDVVSTPIDMKRAIEKHRNCDIVFIDTAGRSQKNKMQMSELKGFIDAAAPDEIHLVLSTTANYRNIDDVVQRFSELPINKIIFTKLDEAVSLGLVLNVISKLDKSLSYITTGQNVPDDIEVSDPELLAKLIISSGETMRDGSSS